MDNDNKKQWYVINTYSGHENKTKDNLEKRIETMEMDNFIFRVIVAEYDEPIMKNNMPTGKMKKINIYPGYVFVEMIMTDEAWFIVRNTPGVTGFVGSSGKGTKPFPVPKEQIESVLKRTGCVEEDMYSNYSIGDEVRIIKGPLSNSTGKILSINNKTGVVKISALFFGKENVLEVDFSHIEIHS